jgi:ABC-2 type transport system permease protein
MSGLSFNRTAAVVLRQYYLLRSSTTRILPIFAWVAVDVVLWGFLTRYLNSISAAGFDFVPLLLGAILFWDFFTRVMHGIAIAFLEDVWSRNFLNFFATPLRIWEYLAGLVITSIGTSAFGLIVMLLLATAAFGLSVFVFGLTLIPFLLILFLFGIAMGIFASALVFRYGPASEWFVWPIPALLSPFAGVFYPVSTLPGWMQTVSRLLPPSYVFENMREALSGHAVSVAGLAGGGALAGLYIVLACWYFARVYRRAVSTGLIVRYSAESIG